jgi:hypothetical protein
MLVWACVGVIAGLSLAAEPGEKCCFKNPAHSGICEATPAEGETCKTIIDYLNTPNSAGKNYCAGTAIRGGWEAATCEAPQ